MTNLELLQAMGRIDPNLIVRAAPDAATSPRRKGSRIKWGSLAACMCLAVGLCLLAVTFMTRDLAEDGQDMIYLFGGVTVNMSNMIFAFFLAPLFSLICTLLMWTVPGGGMFLFIWLFRDMCIPLIHFCIIRRQIRKSRIQKKSSLLLAVSLIFAAVIADTVLMNVILMQGRLALFHTVFRLIWTAICGLLVLGHTVVLRFYRGTPLQKLTVSVGALIALTVNAFLLYTVGPPLATKFAIDGVEILLWPLAIIILSAYSYLLGQILTRPYIAVKLAAWFVGIAASEFMVFYLLGTPHAPPTSDGFMTLLWLAVSAIPFLFCLLGMLKAHLRRKENRS